jgi:hypothetical protein
MKLNILSDLHLNVAPMDAPGTDADVVVLAGDIARPSAAVAWARNFPQPVLYVPGNHEFYGGSIVGTLKQLKELCAVTSIRLLDDEECVIGGVRFLGSTLWTDFMLLGAGEQRDQAILEAQRFMRDFTRIRTDDEAPGPFTPDDAAARFRTHAAWLAGKLAERHAGPTVVITHHAPSRLSIHPRFEGSLLNPCFVSAAEHLVDGSRARLWVHGHTHDSFDYVLNGTRVVCNPRGYAMNGVNENACFDASLVVEVE